MKCFFLRHGIAAERDEWTGSDYDRPLTGEGRKRMAREAKTISDLDLAIDAIITSPLVRARQTADIVATELGLRDRLVEDTRLGAGFGPSALAGMLRERAGTQAVMLVGHDPTMSETIGDIIGDAKIVLKKGGLACVEIDDPSLSRGALLWLLPPKVLTLRARR